MVGNSRPNGNAQYAQTLQERLDRENTCMNDEAQARREAWDATVRGTNGEALASLQAANALAKRPRESNQAPSPAARLQAKSYAALHGPFERGERDPRLLAALGLYEREAGNVKGARVLLEVAAQAKVVRPRAYLELARLRYAEALQKPAGADGRLDVNQARSVLEPLLTARAQSVPPPAPEVYELIAEVWARSAVAPTRENLAVLGEGVAAFPYRAELIYRTASLYARTGFPKEAAALVAHGLQIAYEPADKTRFETLQAALAASPTWAQQVCAPTDLPPPVAVTDSPLVTGIASLSP
jgi:hypothetical protein